MQVTRKSTWNLFPFVEAAARCVIQQVLLALQYMHAKDQYNVSLTPQSVLVSQWWMQRDFGPGEPRDFAPIVLLGGFQYTSERQPSRGLAVSQVRSPAARHTPHAPVQLPNMTGGGGHERAAAVARPRRVAGALPCPSSRTPLAPVQCGERVRLNCQAPTIACF